MFPQKNLNTKWLQQHRAKCGKKYQTPCKICTNIRCGLSGDLLREYLDRINKEPPDPFWGFLPFDADPFTGTTFVVREVYGGGFISQSGIATFREFSYVNIPADPTAIIRGVTHTQSYIDDMSEFSIRSQGVVTFQLVDVPQSDNLIEEYTRRSQLERLQV